MQNRGANCFISFAQYEVEISMDLSIWVGGRAVVLEPFPGGFMREEASSLMSRLNRVSAEHKVLIKA